MSWYNEYEYDSEQSIVRSRDQLKDEYYRQNNKLELDGYEADMYGTMDVEDLFRY